MPNSHTIEMSTRAGRAEVSGWGRNVAFDSMAELTAFVNSTLLRHAPSHVEAVLRFAVREPVTEELVTALISSQLSEAERARIRWQLTNGSDAQAAPVLVIDKNL